LHLPEVNWHFALVASHPEADIVIGRMEAYRAHLASLAGLPLADNVSYSVLPPPAWIGTPSKTFAACARFLVAPALLECSEAVYTIDADSEFARDPTRHFTALQGTSVALAQTTQLPPWRRAKAGFVYLTRGAEASAFLEHAGQYIV